jgi:acyl carrier protein
LAELPLTPGGKVDRAALPSPQSTRRELESAYVSPQGPIEEKLVRILEETLGVDGVGVNDNFFALGGDSLSATQAVSSINGAFGIEFPVRQLLESPSARAVATRVFERLAKEIDESELSKLLLEVKNSVQD